MHDAHFAARMRGGILERRKKMECPVHGTECAETVSGSLELFSHALEGCRYVEKRGLGWIFLVY